MGAPCGCPFCFITNILTFCRILGWRVIQFDGWGGDRISYKQIFGLEQERRAVVEIHSITLFVGFFLVLAFIVPRLTALSLLVMLLSKFGVDVRATQPFMILLVAFCISFYADYSRVMAFSERYDTWRKEKGGLL